MKEIKKVVTREVKETFTGWEAIDGTFFDDKAECNTLEELYLSSRHINYRWCKQSIEEKVITKLKKLL